MLRSSSPPIRPPIMRMHAYLASWHCTGRGWEEEEREEGRRAWWAHSRLDNQCDANCQGGKMSFGGGGGGTNDQRHELSKVQLTPAIGRAARPPHPSHPIQDSLRPHPSWPSILWRCTLGPGSAANQLQLTAKHVFLKYLIKFDNLKASSCPSLLKITGNRMEKEQVHSQRRL